MCTFETWRSGFLFLQIQNHGGRLYQSNQVLPLRLQPDLLREFSLKPVIYAWPHVKMSNDDPFCTRASSLTQPSPTLMGKRMYLMYSDVMQRKRLKLDPNLFFLLWTDTRMHHTHSLTEGSKQCPRPSAPLLKSPLSLFISTAVWGCHHGLRSLAPFRQSELLSCPA